MLQKVTNFTVFVLKKNYSSITNNIIKSTASGTILPIRMSKSNDVKKEKYDGRTKKRQWEDRRSITDPKQVKLETEPFDRIKRRKFVLLMGYSGVDYYGMQRNPNMKTIEEDLFKALLNVKLINEECYNQVQNMQFQRAARTDKGVSAARQVVSMKLGENIDLEKLNDELPKVIRIFAYKRVTKGFNSKSQCDGRTYIYILPTVAFAEKKLDVEQKDFRLSEESVTKINDILQKFIGTKNYHNFTSKKKFNDPSAARFIKSFTLEKPFVRNDVEFAVIKVYGQSFMLHQIRKMIGMVLAIVKGMATVDILTSCFSNEKVNIPRAPGLGLVLDTVHYERYNERYGSDGMHEKLTWEEVDEHVQDFKETHIYPTIINTEIKEEPMLYWIKNKLSRHAYDKMEEEDDDEKNGDDESDSEESKKEQSEKNAEN